MNPTTNNLLKNSTMFSQDHVIMRQQLEITVANQRYMESIQSIIEKLVQAELNPLLDRLFSEYVPDDVVITIDRLVIDGIVCDSRKLKKQLLHKIHDRLQVVLKNKMHMVLQDPQKKHIVPLYRAKMDALEHYLIHGTFSWWISLHSVEEIEKIYAELLERHPNLLASFWFSTDHKMRVIQRLVTHFSPPLVLATIKLLGNALQSRDHYPVIKAIMALQNQKKSSFLEQGVVMRMICQTTLVHLLTAKRLENNVYYLTKKILRKLALRSHGSYAALLQHIAAHYAQKEHRYSAQNKLAVIVQQLYEEMALPVPSTYDPPTLVLMQQLVQRSHEPAVQDRLDQWMRSPKNHSLVAKKLSLRDMQQLLQIVAPKIVDLFTLFHALWQQITRPLLDSLDHEQDICALTLQYIQDAFPKELCSHYRLYMIEKIITTHPALVHPLISFLQQERKFLEQTYRKQEIDALFIGISAYDSKEQNMRKHSSLGRAVGEIGLVNERGSFSDIIDHCRDPAVAIALLCRFLIREQLPVGYADPTDFIAQIMALLPAELCKKRITPLCRRLAIAERIIKYRSENVRLLLSTVLIPFSTSTIDALREIIVKADILHAPTVHAKKDKIDTIFLHLVSTKDRMNLYQLLHYTLLYLGRETSLPQVALFRRIGIAAKQKRFPAFITKMVMEMSGAMEQVVPTAVDALDIALLPIYDRLCHYLGRHKMRFYYQWLLPTMKEAIRKGMQPIYYKKKMWEMVAQYLPNLSVEKRQMMLEILYSAIENIRETRQKKWKLFFKKGRLSGYKTTDALLHDFLATKSIFSKNDWYKLCQIPSIRKQLVRLVPTPYLVKIVTTYYPDLQYQGLHFVKIIEILDLLWPSIKIEHRSKQDFKMIFWDLLLEHLIQKNSPKISLWLANGLIKAANAIHISPMMLVSSLQIVMHNQVGLHVNQDSIEHIDAILDGIQRGWRASALRDAQQLWPDQPSIANLHLLLTRGVHAFPDYLATITDLDHQLPSLATTHASMLRKELLCHPQVETVARRLTYYFSDATLVAITSLLAQPFYPLIMDYYAFITTQEIVAALHVTPTRWKQDNYVAILEYLLQYGSGGFHKKALIRYCMRSLSHHSSELLQRLQAYLAQNSASLSGYPEIVDCLAKMDLSPILETNQIEWSKGASLSCLSDGEQETVHKPQETIRLYLPNAGIILMWPFFEKLFEAQGLMKEQCFVDTLALHNGVHTLQYLATGSVETPEWQLVLPKLLCGMFYNDITTKTYQPKVSDTIIACEDRADPEVAADAAYEIALLKKNCDAAIADAIQEWTNTTPPAAHISLSEMKVTQFREQFLMQAGILQYVVEDCQAEDQAAGYWHLTMKRGFLGAGMELPPWSSGEIFLPWMRDPMLIFWIP